MLEVSKTITFDAAHQLPGTPKTHKCAGLHGHTWRLRIWVTGPVDQVTGWIVDFHKLESIIRREAIDKIDHTCLNDTIPNPTTEHLAIWLVGRLSKALRVEAGVRISKIEIQEGADCWCTWTPGDIK